jgi:hypothetical protein
MSKKVSWSITDQNVVVNYEGQTHIVKRADALAERLIKAVKDGKLSEIPNLVSAAKRIETYSKGNFVVVDGRVMVNGQAAPEVLSNKIIRFSNEGLPFKPLLKFAENLQSNPSFRAVNELFTFLEKNDHPLTENGNFIAYKRVKANFKDIHSGTFDNSVGTLVEIARNQVDEDSSRTCSHGLHVANWTYAHTQFASHDPNSDIMLEVEVNPSDVVAIPADYNNAKMRVCKYLVLGVVTTPFDPGEALRVTKSDKDCSECEGCDGCDDCDGASEVDSCENCDLRGCDGSCEDCCELCGEGDCFGECEDEEDEEYPYGDELF